MSNAQTLAAAGSSTGTGAARPLHTLGRTLGAMQTFLPYADFERSARVLDRKRLGKQRVETIQVVRALTRPGYGWAVRSPAVLAAAVRKAENDARRRQRDLERRRLEAERLRRKRSRAAKKAWQTRRLNARTDGVRPDTAEDA